MRSINIDIYVIVPGAVNVAGVLGLHGAVLVIKHRLDHTISDRLENSVQFKVYFIANCSI